jgi:adenosylcobinamide kinase/adenosylcobinamide-phosphate guanylyltransferase
MTKELILVLGGARSGKSSYAERLAAGMGERVLYLATAQAGDAEMRERILKHQAARPATWRTVDVPTGVGSAVRAALEVEPADVVLVDCLTLLVTNVILQVLPDPPSDEDLDQLDEAAAQERVTAELDSLMEAFRAGEIPWIVVSNEVGLGLVPPYHLGRVFRDLQGWANQRLAAAADRAYFMVASLPLDLKTLSAA